MVGTEVCRSPDLPLGDKKPRAGVVTLQGSQEPPQCPERVELNGVSLQGEASMGSYGAGKQQLQVAGVTGAASDLTGTGGVPGRDKLKGESEEELSQTPGV